MDISIFLQQHYRQCNKKRSFSDEKNSKQRFGCCKGRIDGLALPVRYEYWGRKVGPALQYFDCGRGPHPCSYAYAKSSAQKRRYILFIYLLI